MVLRPIWDDLAHCHRGFYHPRSLITRDRRRCVHLFPRVGSIFLSMWFGQMFVDDIQFRKHLCLKAYRHCQRIFPLGLFTAEEHAKKHIFPYFLFVLGQKLRIFTHCLHRQRSTPLTQPCRDCRDTFFFPWYRAADRMLWIPCLTQSASNLQEECGGSMYFISNIIEYPYMPKGKSKCCQISHLCWCRRLHHMTA